ncbi:TetR/AcrR family transcriptional regulator [Shimia thalassica]|uniref:TetR/AcrR family transcriptional regulator n=1 Tax=Shimia thalassica TaxID=1715693 RepID=UPI0027345394|nr:TetR/AcrR family transcriptional regulator [Shimia thalassica]MDP2496237.1 TetR/AcrR family transcriptional regulator [Shimia thalassica]
MARTAGSHSDITGPRVREAALSLFSRHGYAAVSMRQIAKEVGVQAGALYNYTPDKQTLLFELMRSHMDDLLSARAATGDSGHDAMARLEAFTRFHIHFHSQRPDEVFIAYMELRNLTPENFEVIEGLRRQYENGLEDILSGGQSDGVFAVSDTKIAAMAVIAMLTGVNTWFQEGGRLSLEEVEQIYWDMVRKSVAANP